MISVLLLAATITAQTPPPPPPPKNPTTIEFSCPDHDRDDQHELKILQVTDTNRVTITTILLGDPPIDPVDGMVRTTINMQPIAFGTYVSTINASAGPDKSDDSAESNLWQRVPGRPSKVGLR
jgi:hypothetical protein